MPKRLTDTDKWKDDWFLSLANDDKIVWQWLLDNCSHAGVCKPSIRLLNLMCSVKYTEDEMIEKMEGRVIATNNIWFIPKFLKFQYKSLKSAKPVIVSVVKEILAFKLTGLIPESFGNDYLIIPKQLPNDCEIIKDKDKDMVKDKDKDNCIRETNFEKSERKKLTPIEKMVKIFIEKHSDYFVDEEKDYPALLKIYKNFSNILNLPENLSNQTESQKQKIIDEWVGMVKHISESESSVIRNYQISQIEKYFQNILKSKQNGKKVNGVNPNIGRTIVFDEL